MAEEATNQFDITELKNYLGETGKSDEQLQMLVSLVIGELEASIGQVILKQTFEELTDGNGTYYLFAKNTLNFVANEVKQLINGIRQIVPSTAYRVEKGSYYFPHLTIRGFRSYQLLYSAGFETLEEIPADLRKLIYDEVASVITTGGMQARIASESVSGTSITYRFETTPAKEAVLSKYKNINV